MPSHPPLRHQPSVRAREVSRDREQDRVELAWWCPQEGELEHEGVGVVEAEKGVVRDVVRGHHEQRVKLADPGRGR